MRAGIPGCQVAPRARGHRVDPGTGPTDLRAPPDGADRREGGDSGLATVLFDARLLLDKPTGIGRYIASLLPEMAALAPDWTFHVLRRESPWPGYGAAGWTASNVRHHVTAERHMSLAQHVRIPRRAAALGADLLHYPHMDAPVLFGRLPVVATIHGAMPLVRPDLVSHMTLAKRMYTRFSHDQTARRAAAVIAVSESTARELGRLSPVDPRRLFAVPLAADPAFRRPDDATLLRFRERHGLARPFVLSVGEFRRHKNTAGLVAAWAKSAARTTHDLVLVGVRHPDGDDPDAMAARAGVSDRVRVLTGLPFEDVVAAYAAADIFVMISLYEGFGLPVLEAMACHVPVITSRTTATAEVGGDAAVLVDPEDADEVARAIDGLAADPAARERRAEAGRHRAAGFSWRRTAEETLRVYRRVLGDPA